MIDKKVEEELLLPMVARGVMSSLVGLRVVVDEGNTNEKECEWFEIFFAFDPACNGRLDPDTADGSQAIFELGKIAIALIIERYAEHYKNHWEKIACIGICLDSEWLEEDDLPELEAMIGTKHKDNAFAGCWRFAVRFAPEPYQIEGRCLSAPKSKLDYLDDGQGDYF